MDPSSATLRVVPLGGLGRVGGNMMVYETADDLIVVDCGILFPTADQPGVDYVIPDASYVLERREKLRGFIITHGHEDHLGALPYLLRQVDAPVYGTGLTLALLASKLGEHPDLRPRLERIYDRRPFTVGGFTIDPIPVTHSIPDAVLLALETPAGVVVHTGDFKLDPDPIDGRLTDLAALRALGERGVVALFSDSTNAEKPGHTFGERRVGETLRDLIASAPGRVIVTAFASNLHRLQLVIEASEAVGRRVVPIGRSMQQNVQLGLERGNIRARFGAVLSLEDLDALSPTEVTVLAGGSQGEPHSALARASRGEHGGLQIRPDDRVILSSRRIPGNERAVGNLVNNLRRLGAETIDDRAARVHASGHAMNDEQRQMIELCRPRFFVPIHGEYRHLVRHAELAAEAGVPRSGIRVIEDGQPVELCAGEGQPSIHLGEPVNAGHVFVDGKGVGDVGEVVLRDRRALAETGLVVCVLILDDRGAVVAGPFLTTRGVLGADNSQPLLDRANTELQRAVAERDRRTDAGACAELLRLSLRRFFRRELDRRPLVVPVVLTV